MKKKNILSEKKSAIRKSVLSLLPFVPDRERRERDVCLKCLSLVEKTGAKKVGVYLAGKGELSVDLLIEELLARSVRAFAPVVLSDSEMVFIEVKKGDTFSLNRYGLREPVLKEETEDDFDVVFVPLAAFDDENRRLGKGKGYYDRFLQGKRALKIGVAFIEQKVAAVPCDERDVPLDDVFYG